MCQVIATKKRTRFWRGTMSVSANVEGCHSGTSQLDLQKLVLSFESLLLSLPQMTLWKTTFCENQPTKKCHSHWISFWHFTIHLNQNAQTKENNGIWHLSNFLLKCKNVNVPSLLSFSKTVFPHAVTQLMMWPRQPWGCGQKSFQSIALTMQLGQVSRMNAWCVSMAFCECWPNAQQRFPQPCSKWEWGIGSCNVALPVEAWLVDQQHNWNANCCQSGVLSAQWSQKGAFWFTHLVHDRHQRLGTFPWTSAMKHASNHTNWPSGKVAQFTLEKECCHHFDFNFWCNMDTDFECGTIVSMCSTKHQLT